MRFRSSSHPNSSDQKGMNWGLFLRNTAILALVISPLQTFAGDGVDLSKMTESQCLRRVLDLLQPRDLKKYSLHDFPDDHTLASKIMMKKLLENTGATRWDRDQLPKYLLQHFKVQGMPDAFSLLKPEEMGWSIKEVKVIDADHAQITVKNVDQEERQLNVLWSKKTNLVEEVLIQKKIKFKEPPQASIKRIQNSIKDAIRKKDKVKEGRLGLALRMYNQALRGAEIYPEYYASLIAKAAKNTLLLENTAGMQMAYYDAITSDQVVSILKRGDRTEFSLRLATSKQKYEVGTFDQFGGKLTTVNPGQRRELSFEFNPDSRSKTVDLDHDLEMNLFLKNISKDAVPYSVSLRLAPAENMELRYLDVSKMRKTELERRLSIEESFKVKNRLFKEGLIQGVPSKPRQINREMPEEIRSYITKVYSDPNKGLAVHHDDLNKLLTFMKDAENRSEYISMYSTSGGKRQMVGTVSLVTSHHAGEMLPAESILKHHGLIEREKDLPVIEISRFTMDLGARKQFSSLKFLNIAYHVAGSRDASKIVAFCEERLAKDVLSRSAFHATRTDLIFEGKKYYLLEATPTELLEYIVSH